MTPSEPDVAETGATVETGGAPPVGEREPPGTLPPDAAEVIARVRPRDLAIAILTYNNAETVGAVLASTQEALGVALGSVPAVLLNADAGSVDATADIVATAGLPTVRLTHASPLSERLTVPFHGVPGRSAALRAVLLAAHQVGARALVVLEADVASPSPAWVPRLAAPVLEGKADFVGPVYVRHRYEGTITNLLLAPLIRALYGRRIRQPFGGQQALSARLIEHLLLHPRWNGRTADLGDLWILGTAIADGFSVWEAWLGRRTLRSKARTADLPTMVAQTLGETFSVMHRHEDLWLAVRGSEPLTETGERSVPGSGTGEIDVARMLEGFRLGVRDLAPIWEYILAPETLGDVLTLDVADDATFRFPDELWARVVYDFALGYHYDVVYREHLLRSLVPLYLGRTAAFVLATRDRTPEATEARLEQVGLAFERHKPYLVERWR